MSRQYEQRARAEKTRQTRDEIIEAGVSLIRGASGTPTVTEVAQKAGVSRPTVYSHFHDTQELMLACTDHLLLQYPPPSAGEWEDIEDPRDRVGAVVSAVFAQWEMHGESAMPAGVEAHLESVSAAFDDNDDVRIRRAAVTRIALSYDTWRLLTEQGLDVREAADVMTDLVVRTP